MITWLKLYPNTVGKYFPPRQRKVLPFAINVRYLLASINYRKVLLFAIPIVMYMVAFSSTLRKYLNLDLPKGMSLCWPLYIDRIWWIHLVPLRYLHPPPPHFHYMRSSRAMFESVSRVFLCYLWVNEWCTLNKEICSHFAWKCAVTSKSEKLFTFSPSFHHPIMTTLLYYV